MRIGVAAGLGLAAAAMMSLRAMALDYDTPRDLARPIVRVDR